ncbi:MAG: hypothetical protein ABEJ26_06675 [Halosimplex sp.]
MAHDATEPNDAGRNATGRDPTGRDERATLRTWVVLALVLGSLVGIPALVLGETEFRLLSSFGLPRQLALGVLALVPGFALGGLSLVSMTGWE